MSAIAPSMSFSPTVFTDEIGRSGTPKFILGPETNFSTTNANGTNASQTTEFILGPETNSSRINASEMNASQTTQFVLEPENNSSTTDANGTNVSQTTQFILEPETNVNGTNASGTTQFILEPETNVNGTNASGTTQGVTFNSMIYEFTNSNVFESDFDGIGNVMEGIAQDSAIELISDFSRENSALHVATIYNSMGLDPLEPGTQYEHILTISDMLFAINGSDNHIEFLANMTNLIPSGQYEYNSKSFKGELIPEADTFTKLFSDKQTQRILSILEVENTDITSEVIHNNLFIYLKGLTTEYYSPSDYANGLFLLSNGFNTIKEKSYKEITKNLREVGETLSVFHILVPDDKSELASYFNLMFDDYSIFTYIKNPDTATQPGMSNASKFKQLHKLRSILNPIIQAVQLEQLSTLNYNNITTIRDQAMNVVDPSQNFAGGGFGKLFTLSIWGMSILLSGLPQIESIRTKNRGWLAQRRLEEAEEARAQEAQAQEAQAQEAQAQEAQAQEALLGQQNEQNTLNGAGGMEIVQQEGTTLAIGNFVFGTLIATGAIGYGIVQVQSHMRTRTTMQPDVSPVQTRTMQSDIEEASELLADTLFWTKMERNDQGEIVYNQDTSKSKSFLNLADFQTFTEFNGGDLTESPLFLLDENHKEMNNHQLWRLELAMVKTSTYHGCSSYHLHMTMKILSQIIHILKQYIVHCTKK